MEDAVFEPSLYKLHSTARQITLTGQCQKIRREVQGKNVAATAGEHFGEYARAATDFENPARVAERPTLTCIVYQFSNG